MTSIPNIHDRYQWPVEKPRLSRVNHGWLNNDVQEMLARHLNARTQCVVEVGSWVGKSARFILKHAPNCHLYCIDTWNGSPEHEKRPEWKAMLPHLFDQFIVNLWNQRGRVTPMRVTSVSGMRQLSAAGVKPDLVYIDAEHSEQAVMDDVSAAWESFPGAVIVGDDWTWKSVHRSVNAFVDQTDGARLKINGRAWEITHR